MRRELIALHGDAGALASEFDLLRTKLLAVGFDLSPLILQLVTFGLELLMSLVDLLALGSELLACGECGVTLACDLLLRCREFLLRRRKALFPRGQFGLPAAQGFVALFGFSRNAAACRLGCRHSRRRLSLGFIELVTFGVEVAGERLEAALDDRVLADQTAKRFVLALGGVEQLLKFRAFGVGHDLVGWLGRSQYIEHVRHRVGPARTTAQRRDLRVALGQATLELL